MADILTFQTEDEAFYRSFVRNNLPDRQTRDIIDDLKHVRMLGEDDAIPRGVLFAELAVKSEGQSPGTGPAPMSHPAGDEDASAQTRHGPERN